MNVKRALIVSMAMVGIGTLAYSPAQASKKRVSKVSHVMVTANHVCGRTTKKATVKVLSTKNKMLGHSKANEKGDFTIKVKKNLKKATFKFKVTKKGYKARITKYKYHVKKKATSNKTGVTENTSQSQNSTQSQQLVQNIQPQQTIDSNQDSQEYEDPEIKFGKLLKEKNKDALKLQSLVKQRDADELSLRTATYDVKASQGRVDAYNNDIHDEEDAIISINYQLNSKQDFTPGELEELQWELGANKGDLKNSKKWIVPFQAALQEDLKEQAKCEQKLKATQQEMQSIIASLGLPANYYGMLG